MRTPEPVAGGLAQGIEEIAGLDPRALPDAVLASREPLLLRGLVADGCVWTVTREDPPPHCVRGTPFCGVVHADPYERDALFAAAKAALGDKPGGGE